MKWDDLVMVNLQRTANGNWSFTAYGSDYRVWRSNKGLSDVYACIEQIQECMTEELTDKAGLVEALKAVSGVEDSESSIPPGGEKPPSAGGSKKQRKTKR